MNVCPECGKNNDDDSSFCIGCGTSLIQDTAGTYEEPEPYYVYEQESLFGTTTRVTYTKAGYWVPTIVMSLLFFFVGAALIYVGAVGEGICLILLISIIIPIVAYLARLKRL